jgi:hypothetical protein
MSQKGVSESSKEIECPTKIDFTESGVSERIIDGEGRPGNECPAGRSNKSGIAEDRRHEEEDTPSGPWTR